MSLNTRTLTGLIVGVFAALMFLPSLAHAQDGTNRLTLSEDVINEALRANNNNPNSDLSVDLRPGQIIIRLDTTGQRGNTTTFTLTLIPSVGADGQLETEATLLTINELEIPIDNSNNPNVARSGEAVDSYLNEQVGAGKLVSVIVTDTQITMEWASENPGDPTLALENDQLSLTFTEGNINQMDWVTNPQDPTVSSINVDLQPGQAVVNITRTQQPTNLSYAIIPTTVNDRVTWRIEASLDAEGGLANSLATVWQAYFSGLTNDGSLSEVVITDSMITFNWDITGQGTGTSDPIALITVNEAEVNAALAAYTTEDVVSITVDMQPGQVVLNAVGIGENGNPYSGAVTLIPDIRGGQLNWRVDGLTLNGFVVDGAALQSSNQATGALTQGLNGNQGGGTVTDIAITDDLMTITVRQ